MDTALANPPLSVMKDLSDKQRAAIEYGYDRGDSVRGMTAAISETSKSAVGRVVK